MERLLNNLNLSIDEDDELIVGEEGVKKRVVEGGPWTIGNHLLILHQLQIGEVPHQVPLNHLAFWVQIYDLPMWSFSEGVGRSLGNFIG
ncbi:hypothetical protein ACS0TY_020448 [Phlomoides rotata]